jgi:acyl transferase domain-containing protein
LLTAPAHAILESFDGHESQSGVLAVNGSRKSPSLITPLVFSAYSDASLAANVKAFSEYLATNKEADILNVAWSLQARRTEFSHRKAFSGSDVQQLLENISVVLERVEETPSATLGTQALRVREKHTPKILGVFTGQGAQWPTMGAELLQTSRVFRRTIESLEEALGQLADKPTWSILQELQADNTKSRLHLAEISQPLCTAVQVGLVDLIRSAGISLRAVVGHSSGEIGAAYAAGVISASDAIRIAYYRGVHAKLAAGKDGQPGTMLAAGLSVAQAQSFCERKQFAGRIAVAASNGPSTVTISGDEDAIQELKTQLDEQKTFARMLKVDKAYHSHHMDPCSEPYLKSLQSCNIQINEPGPDSAQWVSSVHGAPNGAKPFTIEDVCDIYWVENMTNSVLFSQAVERAVAEYGPFDIAIEIGPHAALKGPTTQTIKAVTRDSIPYQGILHRGKSDAEAFQSAVGFIWEHLGSKGVNLSDFTASLLERAPIFQKGLPTYQWDHGKQYWKESRLSKNFRTRGQQIHELLGKQCTDNVDAYDLRWRNILSVAEMPWLRGHKFQNQILFPAAGHIALALEASKALSAGREVQLIELEDVSVGRAITLDEDGSEVEILFTLKTLSSSQESVSAQFACYACHNEVTGNMDLCSSGRITLHLGTGSTGVLPARPDPVPGLVRVDTEDFYDSMDQIGLDYTGDFRKIDSIFRTRLHSSASTIKPKVNPDYAEAPIVHPALLDVCFQTVIAAFCFPGDGSFWTPYLPTSIGRIRVNPMLCNARENPHVSIDAYITKESSLQIIGDLNAYNSLGQQEIQLEGLLCSSFSKATPATDQRLFSETVWKPALVSSADDVLARKADKVDNPVDLDAIELNERVAYFYLRTLRERFTAAEVATFEWWYQRLFEFADHLLPLVANDDHPSIQAEWANDTYDVIQHLVRRHPDQIDLQLVVEVGEHLPTFVRGKVPLLEVMMKEDRLTRLYQDGLGVPEVNKELSAIAKQISHQYPSMKILEIGAGTGGMTHEVLREIDGAFSSYTFTDISTGFFEKSQERLQTVGMGRMIFSALDIEKDPAAQGYALGSYDVIIASNVLHATRKLGETMANVRQLLRPGGYLLLNEVTGEMLRLRFIMSGLPGWWLGADDGRRFAPTINSSQWDEVMRDSGFSGVDAILQDFNAPSKQSLSVMVTQAVDEMVDFLRAPLLSPYMAPEIDELFIVGGKDLQNRRLARSIASQLRSWTPEINFVNDILALEAIAPQHGFTVVCLEDLDSPVLRDITAEKLKALQLLFSQAKHILYLTRGSRTNSPYSMAMIGLGRTMLFEHPDLKLQFVDVATLADADARKIAEDLLRLVAAETLDPSYLWTAEPEIAYEESRKQIQRLVPNEMLNSKLNSDRRLITEHVSTKQWQVVVGRNENKDIILAKGPNRSSFVNVPADHVVMDVLVSSAHPISIIGEPNLYLCIGKQRDAESLLAVLSSGCASTVVVPTFLVCEIPNPENLDLTTVLSSLAMQFVAQQILGTGSNIVLHEPDRQFATILLEEASAKDISVTLTTSRRHDSSGSSWLWLHPYETRNRIAAALPSNVDVFIDFSSRHSSFPSSSEPLGERFRSCLPDSCLALSSSQSSRQSSPFPMAKDQNNSQELAETFSRVCLSSTASIEAPEGHVVRVDEILADGTSVVCDVSETINTVRIYETVH